MKKYTYLDFPLEVHGVPNFDKRKSLKRLTDEVMEKVPSLNVLGQRCPGARVMFRTNSKTINFTIEMQGVNLDIGSGLFQRLSSHVMAGERGTTNFAALITSYDYSNSVATATLQ